MMLKSVDIVVVSATFAYVVIVPTPARCQRIELSISLDLNLEALVSTDLVYRKYFDTNKVPTNSQTLAYTEDEA
jgi:hypothetical protein